MNPVGEMLELLPEVLRQGLASLLLPHGVANARVLEDQLAMLAVVEDGGRVRDDLHPDRAGRDGFP
jgi:hypothetical protein